MIFFIIWLASFALLLTFFIAVDDASLPWILLSLIPFFNTIVLLAIIVDSDKNRAISFNNFCFAVKSSYMASIIRLHSAVWDKS